MKKLLTILFALFTFVTQAQIYQNNNGYGFQYRRLKPDSTLHTPTFSGVPTLRGSVVGNQGAIGIDSSNKRFYFYDPKDSSWNFVSSGGSGGRDTVKVGHGLEVIWDSTNHQVLYADHPDGYEGGIVTYAGTGFNYLVSPITLFLNNRIFLFPAKPLTLSPPNSQPRYDIFYVDTLGAFVKMGDSAVAPIQPQVGIDSFPLTQGFLMTPGDTVPSNISTTIIYDKNTEWVTGKQGAASTVDFNDVSNPYHSPKNILISKYRNGTSIYFIDGSYLRNSFNSSDVLSFAVYLNAPIPAANNIYLRLYDTTKLTVNSFQLTTDVGFYRNDTNVYQLVSIPLSKLTALRDHYTTMMLTFTGYDTSGVKGMYIDWVRLQTNLNNLPSPTDYSNKVDSTTISGGNEYWWAKGVSHLAGSVGGGTTTNALTFNNSGSGNASGTTFNGSAARTLSYNSIGAQQALTLTTTGTSGAATLTSGTLNIPQYSGGNDTSIVHIDSVAGQPNWIIYLHSNRTIPPDTSKFNFPKTLLSLTKNATRDSIIATFSDGTRNAVKDSVGTGSGSSSLSSLTAATVPNTIDNGSLNKQEWQWNSLDTTTAFKISSNSTGTTTAGTSPILFNVALSGANARSTKRTYSTYITNTHTGTVSSNVALYAEASGGSNNIAASFVGSFVSISTAEVLAPVYMLDVRGTIGTTNLFTNVISPYSGGTATNFTGFLTGNKGVNILNYTGNNYDYTRANGVGYAALGNDVMSTTIDTTVLRINGNSVFKKVGISGQNIKISDSSVVDAYKYNYNTNAILDLSSTTKAFLPPRLTTTQRDAMVLTGVGFGTSDASHGVYTTGIYVNVALSGGSGSGALARVEFTGGSLVRFIITTPGSGYTMGDVLTYTIPSTGTGACSLTITQLTGVPGMMIFNKTTGKLNLLNNSLVWEAVTSL